MQEKTNKEVLKKYNYRTLQKNSQDSSHGSSQGNSNKVHFQDKENSQMNHDFLVNLYVNSFCFSGMGPYNHAHQANLLKMFHFPKRSNFFKKNIDNQDSSSNSFKNIDNPDSSTTNAPAHKPKRKISIISEKEKIEAGKEITAILNAALLRNML